MAKIWYSILIKICVAYHGWMDAFIHSLSTFQLCRTLPDCCYVSAPVKPKHNLTPGSCLPLRTKLLEVPNDTANKKLIYWGNFIKVKEIPKLLPFVLVSVSHPHSFSTHSFSPRFYGFIHSFIWYAIHISLIFFCTLLNSLQSCTMKDKIAVHSLNPFEKRSLAAFPRSTKAGGDCDILRPKTSSSI